MTQWVKNPPAMQKGQQMQVQPLAQEDPWEEENGNPLQYSWLGNPMDRGAWQPTVHRVIKSRTWLSKYVLSILLGWKAYHLNKCVTTSTSQLKYWLGQKVCSRFSIPCYRNTNTKSLQTSPSLWVTFSKETWVADPAGFLLVLRGRWCLVGVHLRNELFHGEGLSLSLNVSY